MIGGARARAETPPGAKGIGRPLSGEALEAVTAFAREHGRFWKQQLRDDWMAGRAEQELHQLRNTHGPKWLSRFKL